MLFRQARTSVAPILQTDATAVAETGTIEKRIKMILNHHHRRHFRGNSSVGSRISGAAIVLAVFVIGILGCPDNGTQAADVEDPENKAAADAGRTELIERKLKDLVIPSLEFADTPVKDALAFLQQRSVELDKDEADPAKKGFNIVSKVEGSEEPRITLKLTNVPIGEALRYTTALAQLKFKVEQNAVVIIPLSANTSDLYTNAYEVPPNFLRSGSSTSQTAKEVLQDAGIVFPPGGSAIYNPKNSQLIVRNTTDQMELIEVFLDSLIQESTGNDPSPEVQAYLKRVESIILPSVEFVDTPIMDAAAFLQLKSVELDTMAADPAKKGINIVVAAGKIRDAKLSLKMTNVPLWVALRYTAQLAGGGLKVDKNAVVIGYEKSSPKSANSSLDSKAKIAANEKKLAEIILPHVEFSKTPFKNAIQYLQQRSVELDVAEPDPAKKGINVVLQAAQRSDSISGFEGGEQKEATIDLKLSNVPLGEAFRYTCDLAGMEYKIEPHNILISPKR